MKKNLYLILALIFGSTLFLTGCGQEFHDIVTPMVEGNYDNVIADEAPQPNEIEEPTNSAIEVEESTEPQIEAHSPDLVEVAETSNTATAGVIDVTNSAVSAELGEEPELPETVVPDGAICFVSDFSDVEPKHAGEIFVVVDISDQHMWLCQGEFAVKETDIVTGCVSKGRDTPTGEYTIKGVDHARYLRGPGYRCWVEHFAYFNGGIGFHDASWRDLSEFGGDTYIENGSHGCVNMPPEAAEDIFPFLEKGQRVIVQE